MNTRHATIGASLIFATGLMAQVTIGAKLGLNYTAISTSYTPEPTQKPDNPSGIGFHVGGYLQYNFTDAIGFRPELLYSLRGFQQNNTTTTSYTIFGSTTTTTTASKDNTGLSYLEIPLLLSFNLNEHLSFQAGPGLGLLMGGKVKSSGTSTTVTTDGSGTSTSSSSAYDVTRSGSDVTKDLTKLEIGLCVGGIFELHNGLNFGLRYWRGLNTVNDKTDFGNGNTIKQYTNLLQISIGYSFVKPS